MSHQVAVLLTVDLIHNFHLQLQLLRMSYPVPPPAYGSSGQKSYHSVEDDSRDPLLTGSSRNAASGGAIYDQPAHDDLPDDFKVHTQFPTSS